MNNKDTLPEYISTDTGSKEFILLMDDVLGTVCKFADNHNLARHELVSYVSLALDMVLDAYNIEEVKIHERD